MEKEQRREKLEQFIFEERLVWLPNSDFDKDLQDALYSFNESGMFGDNEIDGDTLLKAYALVKTLENKRFPAELKM